MTLVRTQPGRIWRITLARPDQRNAVNAEMLGELLRALGDVAADRDARVVILSGEGRHFCAGADIEELAHATEGPDGIDYGRAFEEVMRSIADLPVPVLAVVQGGALGAGCQLVVACDLAIAATEATFGIPSARLGVVVGFENIQRLVLAVGPKRAGALLLGTRTISGEEAADWGLVGEAVPPEDLPDRALAYAEEIADAAPLSVQASKRGIRQVLSRLSVDREVEGFRVADFDMMAAHAFGSEDLKEGIAAFRERRDPEFRGR
ncbi:MAG TPA: enoyl-CoA hydratase/isomerase family protein [Actinomycetota bacterium]|nr:enoyl-CoA hydratase/isomerase family protein [Actinomycetota bacterium]